MRRRHLLRAAKLLVLLQLVVGLAPASISRCIAADGHTALELDHGRFPCMREVRRHHPERIVIDAEELEHHRCRCVPLLETQAYRGTGRVELSLSGVPVSAPLFLVPPPSAPMPAHAASLAFTPAPPPLERRPRVVRSVILLV